MNIWRIEKKKVFQITAVLLLVLCMLLGMIPGMTPAVRAADLWDGSVSTGYASGSGIESDPYLIETGAQLAYMATMTNSIYKYYQLTADIDLNNVEWTPIGTEADSFRGIFEGNNHTISNLKINSSTSYVGLFRYILSPVEIKNLGLVNVSVTNLSPGKIVGGLVGNNNGGKINNCYVSGSVTGNYSEALGGLVGFNSYGTITNCNSTATVTGGYRTGGLVGNNDATINNCYATGLVTGCSNGIAGGLTAQNSGTINNSYATGSVTESQNVGGLVGSNLSTINNCYATGSVTGSSSIGGLVGDNSNSATIATCYATGSITTTNPYSPMGGLVGNLESGSISNGYWNSSAEQTKSGELQVGKGVGNDTGTTVPLISVEMKTNAFAAMLTSNSTTIGNPNPKRWKYSLSENNGYPVFDDTIGGDTTAPVLTGTGASNAVAAAATLNFTADEAGTYHYLVYAAEAAAPSAMGVEVQGTAVAKGTGAVSDGANIVNVTGLSGASSFNAYIIVEDASGNVSSLATVPITFLAFTSGTTADFDENATGTLYTATATASIGGGTVAYSITGGTDKDRFNMDSSTGMLTFVSSPDYESPADSDINNIYDVVITATDSNGSVSQSVAVKVANVNEAPAFLITGATANATYNGTQTISVSGTVTDPEKQTVDVSATIDGKTSTTSVNTNSTGAWTLTWSISGLGISDGTYTGILFSANDNNGGTDSATYAGNINVDATAPDTTIETNPSALTNSASASFSFSSEAGATFEVSIDGGAYSVSTSPKEYTGLLEGSHTFKVRATDAVGNIDATPASYNWTIDTIEPDTTIDTNPSALTNSASASFSFSSEAGATFEVSIDGGAYSVSTSPKEYTGLLDGSHTFNVRAIDTAGNTDATPASYIWTIDATAPDTKIDISPSALTNLTSASFSSEAGATFEVSIDGGAYGISTSPKEYTGLLEGSHTFNVRATDTVGNTDATPASYIWTIDTTTAAAAPTVTGAVYSSNPQPTWNWVSNGGGNGIFRNKLDNSDLTTGATETSATSFTSGGLLSDGNHTLYVQEKNDAGNWSAIGSASISVDTAVPTAALTSPSGISVSVTASSIVLGFSETVTGVAHKKVSVYDGTDIYTYTIGVSDNYITVTDSVCRATIPVSSFLNGTEQLSLGYDTTYTVAVETGAYNDGADNEIAASDNIGSFKTDAAAPITTFKVTFKDWNGSTLKTEMLNAGGGATAPENLAREGYTFTGWDQAFSNVTSDMIVTAQYSQGQAVTLQSIAITTSGGIMIYTAGDILDISGIVVIGTYSDGTTKVESITVANVSGFDSSTPAAIQILTVTVGDKTATYSITVKAASHNNEDHSGSSNNDGKSASSAPAVTIPSETSKIEVTVEGNKATATVAVTTTVDNSGKATATVTQTQVSIAITKAVEEAAKRGDGTVAIAKIKVEANLSKAAVDEVAGSNIAALTVATPIAEITFDNEALDTISEEAAADVKILAEKVDVETFSEETKQLVGDRMVFNFNVISANKTISQFDGKVSVSIPYTPKAGEDTNAIIIYNINEDGKPEIVSNCAYNIETGSITFTTDHLFKCAVGYNKVSFTDIPEDAWYNNAVEFIAARGITTGTGDGKFSPEEKLTRGQFLVMMMRTYGISPDANPEKNFYDAGNTYYTNYLATAKRLGISEGIDNNMFAPNKKITRQEMFTLLYNALKTIDEMPTGTSEKLLVSFSDEKQIASWAKDAMKLLVETGIISGNDGKLSPASEITRAEMAQVLYNLLGKQ